MNVGIDDIVDPREFQNMIDLGRIRYQTHRDFPYAVCSYTEKAEKVGEWTKSERISRGLIINGNSGEVLARPFAKFFNYGDSKMPYVFRSREEPKVAVFDKLDGSLGIGYTRDDGQVAITTRGSFHSEQAEFASELLWRKYPGLRFDPEYTPLFEIIYPGVNVVDYGETRDIFYLGEVDKRNGRSTYLPASFPCPTAEFFGNAALSDAIATPDRENAEGLVLWAPYSDERVKVKQEDYLVRHRALWSLSPRRLWEARVNGHVAIAEVINALPDEHQNWARHEVHRQELEFLRVQSYVLALAREAQMLLTRREQAEYLRASASDKATFGMAFRVLDGKDFERGIWEYVKP